MPIRLLDVRRLHEPLQADLDAAAQRVLRSGQFILGENVAALERELAEYCGVAHAVGVASGTDALLLALAAAGVQAGEEVLTPSFTFVATAQAITQLSARPVFVDIDERTYNLDPHCLEAALTPRTRAILPVDLFGLCADMDAINALAAAHHLIVIEDAAQAIGASYRGRRACSLGRAGCLSFYPTKNLGGAGDGGMVLTDDAELADTVRMLRVHGRKTGYFYHLHGYNSRLDEIQAALLRVKRPYLDGWNEQRRRHAALYDELLAGLDVVTPFVPEGCAHVYHQYAIRTPRRDELRAWLQEREIDSAIYYPLPLHLQEIYRDLGQGPGSLPVTEQVAQEIVSLPVGPEVGEEGVRQVAGAIREFFDF
jgi:dTDP-4-amino-4,6-dideoxygalactose transaminase